jgi:cardiolipin synthase (CMP-forming)
MEQAMTLLQRARAIVVPWLRTGMYQAGTRDDAVAVAQDRMITWPNAITAIRLLGIPLFMYLVATRNAWLAALILAWSLAALDVADGYLARRLNQVSRIGAILDPVADRLMTVAVCVTLAMASVLPWWAAAAILGRDVLLALLLLSDLLRGGLSIQITRIGKLGSLALLFGIPGLLAARLDGTAAAMLLAAAVVLTAGGTAFYYISLVQYLRQRFTG